MYLSEHSVMHICMTLHTVYSRFIVCKLSIMYTLITLLLTQFVIFLFFLICVCTIKCIIAKGFSAILSSGYIVKQEVGNNCLYK